MKKIYTVIACVALTFDVASAQYASQTFLASKNTDRSLFFSTSDQGQKLPILWGLDTAWSDDEYTL